ncbi:hypothetical protein [Pseudomonas sp. BF-RE-03]|nr:hypothetical protein [Pseudomonas sp. BF-RE-03]
MHTRNRADRIAGKPAPTRAVVLHQHPLLPQQHPISTRVRIRN